MNTIKTSIKNTNLDIMLLLFMNSLLAEPKSALDVKPDKLDEILLVAPEIASETPACIPEACSPNGLLKSIYIIIMDIKVTTKKMN
jgi:hypothetical protein